ncbi:hypothetical protein VPH35_075799 [Triticum aestivum]
MCDNLARLLRLTSDVLPQQWKGEETHGEVHVPTASDHIQGDSSRHGVEPHQGAAQVHGELDLESECKHILEDEKRSLERKRKFLLQLAIVWIHRCHHAAATAHPEATRPATMGDADGRVAGPAGPTGRLRRRQLQGLGDVDLRHHTRRRCGPLHRAARAAVIRRRI